MAYISPSASPIVTPIVQPILGLLPNRSSPLARGLVGYWPLSESTGTVTRDLSGSGAVGTFSDVPVWTAGKYGSALQFDGTNDYIDVDGYTYPTNGHISVSLWVKASATPAEYDSVIGCIGSNWNDGGWCLRWNDADSRYEFFVFRYNLYRGYKTATPTVWHHLVGTWNKKTVRLWVDGIEGTSTAYNGASTSSSDLRIGSSNGSAARNFPGTIQNVMIWNRAIDSGEVAALYRCPWCLFGSHRAFSSVEASGSISPLLGSPIQGM